MGEPNHQEWPQVYKLEEPDNFPTPDTVNYRDGSNLRTLTKNAAKHGARRGISLHHHVHIWPTPSVHGNYNVAGLSAKSGDGLATAVKSFPTPRASEYKDCGPVGSKSQIHMDKRSYLCAKVKDAEKPSGCLSPDWVEWLMGLPYGWTELDIGCYEHYGWQQEPPIPRVIEDCPDRIDRIRLLGNGVVPHTAATAYTVLHNELELLR
jgi:hypothetical protein